MPSRKSSQGFSLIEMLLVLAIIGIVAGIAIPVLLGARTTARVSGDAKANASVINMLMEQRLWQRGGTTYGTAGDVYSWTYSPSSKAYSVSPDPSPLPRFTPEGNSQLSYKITVGTGGQSYSVEITDPAKSNKLLATTDQAGKFVEK